MDKKELYRKIKDIAEQLLKNDSTYTRADLAYELESLGISQDTAEVGMLAWEAYKFYQNNRAIRASFLDNDGKTPLVPEYEVQGLLEQSDDNALFPLVESRLQQSQNSLISLESKTLVSIKKCKNQSKSKLSCKASSFCSMQS